MNAKPPVTFSEDADGVGWLLFDAPDARANVFNPETHAALEEALNEAARASGLKAIVVASAKERIFIAGADLKWLAALPDAAAATEFARRGQRLFQRIAHSSVPVVCAIHGACAGGGFELALACHWRIASDAAVTRMGLPETSLGTIPGWGGCVRLPRLIGVEAALDHILRAQLIGPEEALAVGLVHDVVPAAELKTRAKEVALKLAAEGHPVRPPEPPVPAHVLDAIREKAAQRAEHNPALVAAVDAVQDAASLTISEALECEARYFGEVTAGETCKNLVRVFFLREAAKKRTLAEWFDGAAGIGGVGGALRPGELRAPEGRGVKPLPPSQQPPQVVKRVGVVGAGVMGSGIAQWCAARGLDVVLRDVQPEALERGMTVVRALFDEAVKRGKLAAGEANSGLQRIATTSGWEGFESCDLIIEAIVEDAAAKRELFTELARVARTDAVLASNTSALPIEEIAGHVPQPARTIGIHFFNPVSRMSLVELIVGRETSAETAERALEFLRMLGKSPVICRSSPGFLVTRVLFFYLNQAVRRWEAGEPVEDIDGALREFGWPMGPLRLIDEVGVDVTEFIFGEMAHYFPERFERTSVCGTMLRAGLLGRKNGASRGFYRYEKGVERVNDEVGALLSQRVTKRAENASALVQALMRVMVDEAQRCLEEGVVKSADDVDFALLSGAGFPAFRGGLMHWARRGGVGREAVRTS